MNEERPATELEEHHSIDALSDEQKEAVQAIRSQRLLHIFTELYKSKRFVEFVENNYDIVDEIDEEAKTITTLVIEKPLAVGPQMSAKQVASLHKIIVASGTEKIGETMKNILENLGQDDSGIILESAIDPSILSPK